MPAVGTPSFLVGTLPVCATDHSAPFWFEILVDGYDPGTQDVAEALVLSLFSGSDTQRTQTFKVKIGASSIDNLHAGEKALRAQLGIWTTITYTPPGATVASVYDAVDSKMVLQADVVREYRRLEQVWEITAICLPFARSATKTTVTFPPMDSAANTVADACSATTNFAVVSGGATLSVPGTFTNFNHPTATGGLATPVGEVKVTQPAGTTPAVIRWNGSLTGVTHVGFEIAPGPNSWLTAPPTLNGQPPVAMYGQVQDQYGGSVVATTVTGYIYAVPAAGATPQLSLNTIARDDLTERAAYICAVTTFNNRLPEVAALVPTAGSERSQASVKLALPGSSTMLTNLGFYADPTILANGWMPTLPVSWQQAPAGRYMIHVGAGSVNVGDIITLTLTSPRGATQVFRTRADGSPTALGYPIGPFTLGGTRDGRIGPFTLTATKYNSAGSGGSLTLSGGNSAILLRIADDAALTTATMYAGDHATGVRLDPPSIEHPRGGFWVTGSTGTNLDALDLTQAFDPPIISPSLTPLCLFGAANPTSNPGTVSVEHYAHYTTYAAP